MKRIAYILLVCSLYCSSCGIGDQNDSYSGQKNEISIRVAYPLCDFLTGEDPNGTWTIVSIPVGSTLTNSNLTGDCPSIDFNDYGCGDYVLRYTVESTTCDGCTDFTDLNITLPCCSEITINGTESCN